MAVHDAWQGKRCGRALMSAGLDLADNWMDLFRVELTVFVDNEPAIRIYKGCGFEVEGTLRRFADREGAYVDVLAMARIR